jgi:hypothetical protein
MASEENLDPSFSNESKPKKVFISYSHDSPEHKDRVLALSNQLRMDGVDCILDQYFMSPPQGWYKWLKEEIEQASFVIVVCTKSYNQRLERDEPYGSGSGRQWEGGVVVQELLESQNNNQKFIPIVFNHLDSGFIPKLLRNTQPYILSTDYELLYRFITGQPEVIPPRIGNVIQLPVMSGRTFTNIVSRSNLPVRDYEEFIGRKEQVDGILNRISSSHNQHITSITGVGGVGKTSLALEVAYICKNINRNLLGSEKIPCFDAFVFTSSKKETLVGATIVKRPFSQSTLADIIRVISDVLGEANITQVSGYQRIEQAYRALSMQPTLMIIDNLETLTKEEFDKVNSFLRDVPPPTKIITTTRDEAGFTAINLQGLSQSESNELINNHVLIPNNLSNFTVNDQEKAEFYRCFQGLPGATICAVSQVKAGYPITSVLQENAFFRKELGRFSFENSVAPLRGTDTHKLLMANTFFCEAPCREALIKVADIASEKVDDAFARLQQLSLVTKQGNRYSILATTCQYAMDELKLHYSNSSFELEAMQRFLVWCQEFAETNGGKDWERWRDGYELLDKEWGNINSALHWYADEKQWDKVYEIWENIDTYVDLNGYWDERYYWWTKIEQEINDISVKVKALSEKAWTLILQGLYPEADDCLSLAWRDRECVDLFVQADIANHFAILEKCRARFREAKHWLMEEKKIISKFSVSSKEKTRHQAQNLYYSAEIHQIQGNLQRIRGAVDQSIITLGKAKTRYETVIEKCQSIGWDRFQSYAENMLADILIEQNKLDDGGILLARASMRANAAQEIRRMALCEFSFARLNFKLYKQAQELNLNTDAKKYWDTAKLSLDKSLTVFRLEHMVAEVDQGTQMEEELNQCFREITEDNSMV